VRFNIVPEIFFCQIPEMVQKTWVLFHSGEGVSNSFQSAKLHWRYAPE